MKREYKISEGLDPDIAEKALKSLKLGYLNLQDGFFEQANLSFLLTIKLDEKCADAYWGLMLAKFSVSNEDDLSSNPVMYKNIILLPECQKAIELGDEDQTKIYETILESICQINIGDNY